MEILAGAISADNRELQPDKTDRRRQRRDIKLLIQRELSFSGEAMTSAQIAKAIGYIPALTETVLKRLEVGGKVRRDESSRWALVLTGKDQPNGHLAGAQEFSSTKIAA